MELMVIVLNKEEYLEPILSILAELEISDAIIQDGERLGDYLAHEVPIFAGLRQMIGEKRAACKTILALIDQKDFLAQFNKLLTEEKIDFTQEGVGSIAIVAVNKVIKSKE
ncbi:MAG: hypothetical protein DRP74_00985 [Candidatus Omnitrophota bacterium]|nr:MAG: hypothetical protein DRP74_00985 [Candidatus Omnitrophota bacterium]